MLYKRPFFIIRFLFMKHIIDIDTWERRDNYGFFRTFLNSWYSVTTEIDCTEASAAAKQSGHSFFFITCMRFSVQLWGTERNVY